MRSAVVAAACAVALESPRKIAGVDDTEKQMVGRARLEFSEKGYDLGGVSPFQ